MGDSPLRTDPTRTTTLVNKFEADIVRRLRWVKGEVYHAVGTQDGWALERESILNVGRQEFKFETDAGKLQTFLTWLQEQFDTGVLTTAEDLSGVPWTQVYVESAYKRGAVRAYIDSKRPATGKRKAAAFQAKAEFLNEAFNAPETLSKIALLGTRSFELLRGITTTMSKDMAIILADGIAHGRHPYEVARALTDKLGSITRSRALMIARTEIIHAHAEGQLDTLERLGITEVGLMAEWVVAAGACPLCQAYAGRRFTISEARGLIPLHPNCRCTWVPYHKIFDQARENVGRVANAASLPALPPAWWAWWRAA